MTTTSPETRRARSYAAQPAYRIGWTEEAACRGTDTEAFFDDHTAGQNQARVLCRRCPVLETCLAEVTDLEDAYRFGVYAGLNSEQRRALPWELALHGRPDFRKAKLLVSGRYAHMLRDLRLDTPEHAAGVLRGTGLAVDDVTVRLAMWWMGYRGSRVPQRAKFETAAQDAERIGRLCRDVIVRLRGMGATYPDIAAYLGVAHMHIAKAVPPIEAELDAALRADLEVAA